MMNGEINGFHGQHSHEGIPNGGTTLNGQADFIRNSLEWITSEMVRCVVCISAIYSSFKVSAAANLQ